MKFSLLPSIVLLLSAGCFTGSASRAEKMTVVVTHDLGIARPAEMIAVPWADVARNLPGALLQKIAVKDAHGRVLPYQVTNIAPQAKDPEGRGIAYGELLFQHDFAAGEKTATFTVERIDTVAPVFPARVFARYVPERLDDFAWENDRIGHRTYGPALAAPAPAGIRKEVLVTSGLDVWCKRVTYPIVDRWYNKGHDHYHKDQGEGMDMFQVGPSRGCGGLGIWDGQRLHVSGNYTQWKVLANGPIRAIFELTYDAWEAGGLKVAETKRFTVDAGHNFDLIESSFTVVEGSARELTVGIGLNKNNANRDQAPSISFTTDPKATYLSQWTEQKDNGAIGTAVIVLPDAFAGFTEDSLNQLVLARAESGKPLRYYAGAGWSRSGQFATRADWEVCVAIAAARARSPVRIAIAPVR